MSGAVSAGPDPSRAGVFLKLSPLARPRRGSGLRRAFQRGPAVILPDSARRHRRHEAIYQLLPLPTALDETGRGNGGLGGSVRNTDAPDGDRKGRLFAPRPSDRWKHPLPCGARKGLQLFSSTGDPAMAATGGMACCSSQLGPTRMARPRGSGLRHAATRDRQAPLGQTRAEIYRRFGWCTWETFRRDLSPEQRGYVRAGLSSFAAAESSRGTSFSTTGGRTRKRISRGEHRKIRITEMRREETWQPASGSVIVSTPNSLPDSIFAGQPVEISGVIARPPPPLADGLFDYRDYLQTRGIYYQLKAESTNDWRLRLRQFYPRRR